MIVWVASFPRSRNTFLRILLNRMYGVTTSTVYDVDGVAARLGPELVGFTQQTLDYETMRAVDAPFFIKTHRPRDATVHDSDAVIHLVRDGRDAVVSWARQRAEHPDRSFEGELSDLVLRPEQRGAGQWGANVLSWLDGQGLRSIVRFERLIAEPTTTVTQAVAELGLDQQPGAVVASVNSPPSRSPAEADIPSFDELRLIDPAFFRVGRVATHRSEMPTYIQEAFLASDDNRAAMAALGYQP